MQVDVSYRWMQVGQWPGWLVALPALALAIGIVAAGAGLYVLRIRAARAASDTYFVVFHISWWVSAGLTAAAILVAFWLWYR